MFTVVFKIPNNPDVKVTADAGANVLELAQKAGVDPAVVVEAIRGGLAGSTVMNAKAPMMIAGNDRPGFKVDLHIKDLANALECAHAVGAPLPMTAEAMEVLQVVSHSGGGNKDHSAMAQYYEKLAGIRIGRD